MFSLEPYFIVPVLGGMICHGLFNRFEPTHPALHFLAFFAAPVALVILLRFTENLTLSFGTGLQFLFIYISSLLLSVSAYRLSPLHPLAQYPGPLLCKLSKIWLAYISWQGKQHLYYQDLHKRYGDAVRIGPNELSICNPSVISPLLGQAEFPKGPMWDGRGADAKTKPLIGIRDIAEHTRRRRPWNRAFRVSALKEYEPVIIQRAEQLKSRLAQQAGAVDLAAWLSYFAYDFMSDMAFGGGFELMRDGDKGGIWHLLDQSVPTAALLGHLPWIGQYWIRVPFIGKSLHKFRTFAMECTVKRTSEGSSTKDIFHYLNNEDGHDSTPPPIGEVISGGVLAILAGSDTTATALSNAFCMLLANPQTYRRLRDEIDAHFAPGDDVTDCSAHGRMHYLNAVINESLRMFPPVVSGTQRSNLHHAPTQIVGPYPIPGGTSIITNFYTMFRDPRNFSDPDLFLPERWLPSELQATLEPEKFSKESAFVHEQTAFIPFSFGPSNCVGKALAYQEMRMVICILVRAFEMRLVGSPIEWVGGLEDYFVMRKPSLMVQLTPRKDLNV